MNYYIFDLETQNHVSFKRTANPFDTRNWVVAYGWRDSASTDSAKGLYYPESTSSIASDWFIPDHVDVIVGHNVKFDLLYVWEHPSTIAFIKRGGKIWDTQLAQYFLEAQSPASQMCSMDSIAESYGGTLKMDVVKQMWNDGVLTADIPEDILMEYLLDGDIPNTEAIFLGQLARSNEAGMTKMISTRMDSLLCTIEMEHNGLFVDTELGYLKAAELNAELIVLANELSHSLPELPDEVDFNWGSRYHLSALLFGGAVVYKKWLPHLDDNMQPLYSNMTVKEDVLDADGNIVRYLSGKRKGEIKQRNVTSPDLTKPKGKIHELTIVLPQQVKPRADWKGKQFLRDGTPIYGTGADVIEAIGKMDGIGDIASLFAKYTKLDKDVGTYYINADGSKGMLTCVNELQIIHHSLNHCTTKTTRMSASDPNCQNLPRGDKSEVKKMFVSRFDAGRVAEIDYSQLEIVIQAWLTGCEAMIADVNDGIDFHCKRLSAKLSEPYEHVLHMCKEEKDEWYGIQRTIAKGFTFQRAYGAGAPAIAGDLNVPVEEIEQLIAAEELLYPGLSVFDSALEAAIMESAKSPSMTKREAHPFIPNRFRAYKQGQWQAPTGTLYKWRQWDAPDYLQRRGIAMTFKPTERKNWPMQGMGGEVMQMALGLCFRHFVEQGWWSGAKDADALLTNTVHDCAWVDMRSEDVAPTVLGNMHDIMVNIPLFMNKRYGIDVPVKFKAEVEVGKDMYDMQHLHELTPTVNVDQLANRYL